MHQIASELNKPKREPFLMLRWFIGITEIFRQVTSCNKIFSGGYHHRIPGKIIMLPANYAIAGLQSGSFREASSRNGKNPRPGVPFYGFMGNVR